MTFRTYVVDRLGAARSRRTLTAAVSRSQRPRVTARTASQHADVHLPVRMNLPV